MVSLVPVFDNRHQDEDRDYRDNLDDDRSPLLLVFAHRRAAGLL